MGNFTRIVGALLVGVSLMGCAGGDDAGSQDTSEIVRVGALPPESGRNDVLDQPGQMPLQCVPYARDHSEVKLYGDAWTWWDTASGKYARGASPAAGTVMVLFNYAGPNHGHVAVVKRVVSAREIRIDHANWLNDGSIFINNPVMDVSTANDWSQVRVWNIKTGAWGTRIYPVQGFIGAGADAPRSDALLARAEPVRPAPPAPSPIRAAALPVTDGHALTADDLAIP